MIGCLVNLGPDMIDEAAAKVWMVRRLHPAGPTCPGCGVSLSGRQSETFVAGGRVNCSDCGRWFTARTGTPLEGSPASWRQMFLLILLTSANVSVFDIAKACRMSVDTVVSWQRRFREGCQ